MKDLLINLMIILSFMSFSGCKCSNDPATWSIDKIDTWFEKGEWLNGWSVTPDASIDRKEFAVAYLKNKERWDKAFAFFKNNDLTKLELKRYNIDGDNLYAPITEYMTRNEEDAQFEAHRNYIDIQYVISGSELIGLAPVAQLKEVTVPYDASKDVEFMTVSQLTNYKATPERFFIFFPSDIHRLRNGESSQVRKVVVKLKID